MALHTHGGVGAVRGEGDARRDADGLVEGAKNETSVLTRSLVRFQSGSLTLLDPSSSNATSVLASRTLNTAHQQQAARENREHPTPVRALHPRA